MSPNRFVLRPGALGANWRHSRRNLQGLPRWASSSSAAPRIAIVGGGPAGLALGALLNKNRVPFTIFEFRSKPTEASLALPSGMLDLHEGSGLDAIRDCGVYDEFVPLTGECSEEYKVADITGNPLFIHNGNGGRPEIARNNLYKLLLTRIPEASVQWGHKLASASYQGGGTTELQFANGSKQSFDLVIGADGAWSKVRPLVTDVRPHYSGTQVVTITIRNITEKYPKLAELVGSGSFTALGNRQAVISQRGPMDSARIYLWLKTADEAHGQTSGLAALPASSAKETLVERAEFLGGFGSGVKDLVTTACDEEAKDHPDSVLDIRPLYTLPHGVKWENKPGVTLVGDAAHLMLPNGEGVNQAMLDAVRLSKAIVEAHSTGSGKDFMPSLTPLVQKFEAEMMERAVGIGKDTDQLLGMMLGSDDAAQQMLAFFQSARGDQ